MKNFILFLFVLVFTACSQDVSNSTKCPYLGEISLGLVAKIFAFGIVSNGMNNRDITFSPDGKEIYLSAAFL